MKKKKKKKKNHRHPPTLRAESSAKAAKKRERRTHPINSSITTKKCKKEAIVSNLPNREDTTSLVKISFTRNTTDALLEDRGDLSGRSLGGGKTSGQGGASDLIASMLVSK